MSDKPERLANICKHNHQLSALRDRARQLDLLNLRLQELLPIQFSGHIRLANIKDQCLILVTDKAAYASLIRFQTATICKTLSAHLSQPVSKLEVKVRPDLGNITSEQGHNHLKISHHTADLLRNTAQTLEEGPLKQALKKLASRQSDRG